MVESDQVPTTAGRKKAEFFRTLLILLFFGGRFAKKEKKGEGGDARFEPPGYLDQTATNSTRYVAPFPVLPMFNTSAVLATVGGL